MKKPLKLDDEESLEDRIIQQKIEIQKNWPEEGIKKSSLRYSAFFSKSNIGLEVSVKGAYWNHNHLMDMLTKRGINVDKYSNIPRRDGWDGIYSKALFSGSNETYGEYKIEIKSDYTSSSKDQQNKDGYIKLKANRTGDFGEINKIVASIKEFVDYCNGKETKDLSLDR